MPKPKSMLKMALLHDQGKDEPELLKKQHQKKLAKAARKEKSKKLAKNQDSDDDDDEEMAQVIDGEAEEDIETPNLEDIDDSDDSSDSEIEEDGQKIDEEEVDEDEVSDDESIPMSDIEELEDEERDDLIPHQRLTINNTVALKAALRRIELPTSTWSFSEHQSLTTAEPVIIEDVGDDLKRELAFYAQSLEAVKSARDLLKKEGAPFSRPKDYFAEMVKADEHMAKIKAKLIEAAASKKASAEARKQRDLKKFGKQVQVAKIQEREKEKRSTLEQIKTLKRKRQGADVTSTNEADMFDVALDEETSEKPNRRDSRGKSGDNKRAKKDAKYGHGGKKRFSKSNDAKSAGDLSGFSVKGMKARDGHRPGGATGGHKKNARPGKSKRTGSKKF